MHFINLSGYLAASVQIKPVEYLQNGCRYGHSYYGRRIGKHTQALNGTSFNDLERPLIQFSRSRYYLTSNNSQISE